MCFQILHCDEYRIYGRGIQQLKPGLYFLHCKYHGSPVSGFGHMTFAMRARGHLVKCNINQHFVCFFSQKLYIFKIIQKCCLFFILYLISLVKIQQKPFVWELIGDDYKTDVNMKNWSQLEGRQNEFTLKRDKEGGERRWHRYRTQVCWHYEAACLCHWRVCKDPRWTCAVGTSCKRLMSLCVCVCECVWWPGDRKRAQRG